MHHRTRHGILCGMFLLLVSCQGENPSSSSAPVNSSIETLPSLKEVYASLQTEENYTVTITSQITNLNYQATKRYTKDACYFDSTDINDPFGLMNASSGVFRYRICDHQVNPGYVVDSVTRYQASHDLPLVTSLSLSDLPNEPFHPKWPHLYSIDSEDARETFALLSDLVGTSDLTTYIPTVLEINVVSAHELLASLTFATQGVILGKVDYRIYDIGTTTIPEADAFLKEGGTAKDFATSDLATMQSMFKQRNFQIERDSDNDGVTDYTLYYLPNAVFQDYSTALENGENHYVDEGTIQIQGKTEVEDGFYAFTRKDDALVLGERYNIAGESLYDYAFTPGFLEYEDVLKTFDEPMNGNVSSIVDFYTTNPTTLSLIETLSGISTQAEYGFYVVGAGLKLVSSDDVRLVVFVYYTSNGSSQTVYFPMDYTNFGKVSLPFLDHYLANLK